MVHCKQWEKINMQEHYPVPLGMPSSVRCIEHSFIGFPSREKRIRSISQARTRQPAQTYHPDAGRQTEAILMRTGWGLDIWTFASLVYDPPPCQENMAINRQGWTTSSPFILVNETVVWLACLLHQSTIPAAAEMQ